MPYKDPLKKAAYQKAYVAEHVDDLKAYQEAYRKKHHQRILARMRASSRAHYLKNREAILERQKARQRANKENKAAYDSARFKAFPEKYNRATARRRAKKLRQLHPANNSIIERGFYKTAKKRTKETGVSWCVDHIIPLDAGGWHHHENLQLMESSINSSKSNNPTWEKAGYLCWRNVPQYLWPSALVATYLKQP